MAKIDVLRLKYRESTTPPTKSNKGQRKTNKGQKQLGPHKVHARLAPIILQSPDVHITVPVEMSSPPLLSTPLER